MRFSEYLYSKAALRGIPLSGGLELSPLCNFACRMCYVRRSPAQLAAEGKRLRSADEWLKLAGELKEAGTLYLLLTGGEPFLYPEFRRLYETLHDMGFVLSINTNGSLIDESTVAWLKERMPSRINVTLYGGSPETYAKVCGNAAGYEKTIQAIETLHRAGLQVVINATMIPENSDDMARLCACAKELDVPLRATAYIFPPVRREKEENDSRFTPEAAAELYLKKNRLTLSEAEYLDFLHRMTEPSEKKEEETGDTWGTDYEGEAMHCRAGRCSFWIGWDGTMTACTLMEAPLKTRPFERPFAECWQDLNEAVKKMTVLADCRDCDKRHICRPCAAMLSAETGDANRKAPYLCKMSGCIWDALQLERERVKNEGKA